MQHTVEKGCVHPISEYIHAVCTSHLYCTHNWYTEMGYPTYSTQCTVEMWYTHNTQYRDGVYTQHTTPQHTVEMWYTHNTQYKDGYTV